MALVTSLRWGISWTPSAVPHLTQLQSCFKEKSMTGQRWTSGAWGWSCTRWSAGHFLLMDRTSRYSYFVSTPAMIHSSLFRPYLLESGKESIQCLIALFSDCDIELINWYQLLWYLQQNRSQVNFLNIVFYAIQIVKSALPWI